MAETLLLFVLVAWIVFYALARRWFRNQDIHRILELFTPGIWEDAIAICGQLYPEDQMTELKTVSRLMALMEQRGLLESDCGDRIRGYRITQLGLAQRRQRTRIENEA